MRLLEHNNAGTKDPLMFSAVPEYALSQFMSLSPRKITLLDGWGDYIYNAEKLASPSQVERWQRNEIMSINI